MGEYIMAVGFVLINVAPGVEKKVFDTIIPRNVRLAEAPSFGQPIIFLGIFGDVLIVLVFGITITELAIWAFSRLD